MSRLLIIVAVATLVAAACSAEDGSGVSTESAPITASTLPSTPPSSPNPTTTTSMPATTSTTAATTTTTGDPSTSTTVPQYSWDTLVLPPFLLAGDGLVSRVADGGVEVLTGVDGTAARAFATSTGVVLVDEIIELDFPQVHQYLVHGDGDTDWMLPDDPGHLLDLVEIGGIPHIVYVAGDESPDAGLFFLRDLLSGADVGLGTAYEGEYGVYAASVGGRLIAISAVADLTEVILFHGTDGEPVERPSPTDDLAYHSPPFVGPAELSPDGSLLAYIEQPDPSPESPGLATGDTTLIILEMETGAEDLRLPIGEVDGIEALDYDGRWVAVTATIDESSVPILVDTGSPALEIIRLGDLRGVASLA
ncbi:MAG: hypothetical protein GY698_15815 [Actinomycetia bacterium]|nr:hypothetical protein [Actinomycetes bacterium]